MGAHHRYLLIGLAAATVACAEITVHVVPHTHDDVGWLKTVDEYYSGLNNSIQPAYVKMILDTVIRALAENPNRTFIYVEQAFFQRWWRRQPEHIRDITRRLVKTGQLEMSNGGWCMHDEAAPHYMDMIDQTTVGHKYLMDQFGVFPKTGWQIDPFGHSATQAALLSAEVGFEGLFFGRIDYQDLDLRRKTKKPEFIWRPSPSLGADVQVFSGLTGEYGGNYGPPDGFDWNINSNSAPVQDDPSLEDYNVKSRVDDFVAAAVTQANMTRGTNIMFTMGSDFNYADALTWFDNLDKIIKYVNLDGRVKAVYSTPARYVAAKAKENISWPLKERDFFPYADGPHQFWTGYFTSRPALKRYIRETGAYLRTVQQLAVLGGTNHGEALASMEALAEAQGVAQHHDAVSGTAKQHVTFDYAKRLAKGRADILSVASSALGTLSHTSNDFVVCDLLNVSVCAQTTAVGKQGSSSKSCFALWNSIAQPRDEVVELPVGGEYVRVTQGGKSLTSQLVESPASISNYGVPLENGAKESIVFQASLPALGYQSYCLEAAHEPAHRAQMVNGQALENDLMKIDFCENAICKITDKKAGIEIKAQQSWLWYNASVGNAESGQKSGAYIFRPNSSEAFPVFSGKPTLRMFKGPVVDEVFQTFGSWIDQRVRLAHGDQHIEITYTVGEVDIRDNLGKEIVSRFSTDLQTNGMCLTDSNGREMIERKRDFRHSWEFNQTEPVAGNYYPITTALAIRDKRAQLTALIETSQAGSGCVRDGELELMVHRRLLEDDGRGVGEPLNETQFTTPYVPGANGGQASGPGLIVRGKHFLTLNKPTEAAKSWRPLMDRVHMPALPFFNSASASDQRVLMDSVTSITPLPPNVQLVTLNWWNQTSVLLRLAHQFGIDEDAELSKEVKIDLHALFKDRKIESINERGLTGTISRGDVVQRRIPWQVDGEDSPIVQASNTTTSPTHVVALGPLQIRTFILEFAQEQTVVVV